MNSYELRYSLTALFIWLDTQRRHQRSLIKWHSNQLTINSIIILTRITIQCVSTNMIQLTIQYISSIGYKDIRSIFQICYNLRISSTYIKEKKNNMYSLIIQIKCCTSHLRKRILVRISHSLFPSTAEGTRAVVHGHCQPTQQAAHEAVRISR